MILKSSANYYTKVIDEAKKYIRNHMRKQITLEEVAVAVHLSGGHLSRLFRKVTGQNFIVYLTDLRMEEGKKLLESGQYRVYEVSEMVGYTSSKHFRRLFRHKYGLTPNEFMGKGRMREEER